MDEVDKFIEKSKWPCGKLICVEPEYIGKFGCHGCRLNFTETRPSRQHCTQCEIGQQNLELISEVERLKGENEKLKSAVNTFMWGIKTAMLSKDKITVSTKINKETFTILSEYQTEKPNEVTK